ncbi:MAG: DUF3307 domain-containing protein [Marinosulfonomonas sp.]
MAETLAALLLAHVLADYVFQTTFMVKYKSKPTILLLHGVIVLATLHLCTGTPTAPGLYILAALHLIIDAVKVRFFDDSFRPHIVDQIIHLVSLVALAAFAPDIWSNGFYSGVKWLPALMLLVAGGIYTTRAGGFAIEKFMRPFQLPATEYSLPGGGAIIGLLERGLIYVLMLAGLPIGIGFLIAAKSVLRFETIQGTDDKNSRHMAEYVIIGTLASFGWAILVSLAVIILLQKVPDLGIGLPAP